ncbi:MAG TPA: hypothetical protein VL171_08490 [Verrucomicrobiae bacterium]|nr:hypothetical protein [Verrucomicrobiae bacterium]
MDFLKKYYDKLVLATALLALIASAVWLSLKINGVNSELTATQVPHQSRIEASPHVDMQGYSNAIALLKDPPLWTNKSPMFSLSPSSQPEVTVTNFPVILMSVVREPFKLLFKAYSYDSQKKEGYNFQINFQFRRTFFVRAVGDEIKDRYGDTGYQLTKFERKFTTVYDPTVGGQREQDVSELTVQHPGENPVVLVYLQETEEQEPVAIVRCGPTGTDYKYRRGQQIFCNNRTYKVVDIDLKQMVIVDVQTEEQRVIKPQT